VHIIAIHTVTYIHQPNKLASNHSSATQIRKQTDKDQAAASCSCNQRGALTREMRWLALVVSEKCWYKNTLRRNKCHGSRISHPIRFSMKSSRQTSEIDRVGVMVGGTYLGFQEIRCGVDDGRRVHRDALAASPRSADAAGDEGEEEEEEGPREGRRVQADGRSAARRERNGGGRRRRWIEETPGERSHERRKTRGGAVTSLEVGKDRHEEIGGLGLRRPGLVGCQTTGRVGPRTNSTWWADPGKWGGSLGDYGLPKGALTNIARCSQ
jgi:hypothetical protein